HGAQLVQRPLANPKPLFMGLRQSRRRISVRHVFGVRERGRRFDLEISADVFTTGRCTLDHAPFRFGGWRIFARAGPGFFYRVVRVWRADRLAKRLDYLLGSKRLVWCTWCVHLAALGMVGSGTRSGCATNEMAVSVATAVCLSARYRRISLH